VYLVGYDSTNIYRVWVPTKDKVISTRDVTFDESETYDPSAPLTEIVEIIKTIQIPTIGRPQNHEDSNSYVAEFTDKDSLDEDSENEETTDEQCLHVSIDAPSFTLSNTDGSVNLNRQIT
jgi:hypothetical protein